MEPPLKNCPFCGGPAKAVQSSIGNRHRCDKLLCPAAYVSVEREAWNARAEDPRVAALVEAARAYLSWRGWSERNALIAALAAFEEGK